MKKKIAKAPATQQELKEQELKRLQVFRNRLMSQFSFGRIKTQKDLLLQAGYSEEQVTGSHTKGELETAVGVTEIKALIQSEMELIHAKYAPASAPSTKAEPVVTTTTDIFRSFPAYSNIADHYISRENLPDRTTVLEKPPTKQEEPEEATSQALADMLKWYRELPLNTKKDKAKLLPFQERAAAQLLYRMLVLKQPGQLLLAPVGTGKTYMIGRVARLLVDTGLLEKSLSPWPGIYVTKAPIVEQTERVLENEFGIDIVNEFKVVNIEQLRSSFGDMFLKEETIVEHGEVHIVFKWKPVLNPMVVIWDECQVLKNDDSQQSAIAQAYNDIPQSKFPTYQVHMSATPFTRVSEAKCFVCSTRIPYTFGVVKDAPMSNMHWPDFAKAIAYPADPTEHSPAAMGRLMEVMMPYITDVKNVRSKFKAKNSTRLIDFESPREQELYHAAWEAYLQEKARIEGSDMEGGQGRFAILVQFLKFRQAAELIRAGWLAKQAYHAVQEGYAAVIAVNFKRTIARIVKILHYEYGVSRDVISLIWGGGEVDESKKKKKNSYVEEPQITEDTLSDFKKALEAAGIDSTGFDLDELIDKPAAEVDKAFVIPDPYEASKAADLELLRLGKQSKKMRQVEIDNFQSGKSHYCIFSFKSGGVGLSLHHASKHNGVDIPLSIQRPRRTWQSPTYSAIELVQGLGRAPRLTSESDTLQEIVFYRGTIEERVASKVSIKLKCLKKVVRAKESWEDVIVGGTESNEADEQHIKGQRLLVDDETPEDDDANSGMLYEDEDEE